MGTMAAPPPYATFREFSCFIPEIADFGMSWASFQKMAGACGVLALGGYEIGDLCIMFKQHSIDAQILTYQGFTNLARIVDSRSPEVAWTTQHVHQAEGDTLPKRQVKSARTADRKAVSRHTGDGLHGFLGGAAGLAVKLRPPCLVREVIPLPACKQARIASKIEGIQVMIKSGELKLAKAYIPQLTKDWIEAIVEEAQLRGDEQVTVKNTPLPEDGQAWLNLVSAQISLDEGRLSDARSHLKIASNLLFQAGFDEGHDFSHASALCKGVASYFSQEYEEALDDFSDAHQLAIEALGSNPAARRHEAAALNNMAVCMQMLGRHTDAIRYYRAAISIISLPVKEPIDMCNTLRDLLYRNLNRALRFQIGSPRLINPCEERDVKQVEQHQSMASFLEKMIVARPKSAVSLLTPPPKQAKPESKGKKDGSTTKKKVKKKEKKTSGTVKISKFPGYTPHYGVENVKLPAPKKGKKKGK